MTVKLTEEQKIKVLNGEDLYGIMQRILLREKKIDRNKEHLWVVALSTSNHILLIELIGLGTIKQVLTEPSDVFAFALQKQTAKVILVHNHPSGELHPSESDLKFTSRMISVGKLVGCEVLDHLIISEKGYFSFVDEGIYYNLERDAVDLTFKEVKKLEKQLKLREEREKQLAGELAQKDQQHKAELERKAIEMARVLLAEGFEAGKVATLTGLPEVQVAALAAKP